ncbi:rod shape-determining protein MreD [bacterium]|nr:MAG: rod shape-determining protein MreD [bacterium]
MKRAYFLLILIAFGLLQSTLLNYLRVFGVKPDILLISVVIASLYFDWGWGLFFSISAGLIKDILGVYPLGINTALFTIWSIVIMQLVKKINLDYRGIRTLLIFTVAILNDIITSLILISGGSFVPLWIFLRISLLSAVYTASVWPLIFKAVKSVL